MKIETREGGRIAFFQDLYKEAEKETVDLLEKMQRHLKQYKGSAEIDGSSEEAKLVRNITYELVESQATSYIPNPLVSPKMFSEKNERNAKNIETLLRNLRDELPFEKMNDIDERYNPIYGGSVWLTEWDNSIVTHNTVGAIKISCLSPRRFIGQPHIYEIQEMEYCFITFETTKEDLVRRYHVSLAVAEETESEENADDKTATLYVCYFKNDADKVCQYIWSGDTELLYIDDYYARKRSVCKKCGNRKELCTCENTTERDYELQSESYEEIDHDITLSDGTVIPAMSPVIHNGMPVMETVEEQVFEGISAVSYEDQNGVIAPLMQARAVPKMEPTRLPFYTPKLLPVVIRKNTSEEDSLFGQSDCEFIRPQQQAINKIESRIMEKLLKGGVFPKVPDDFSGMLDNSILEHAFRVKHDEVNLFGQIDLQPNVSQDIAEAERLYNQAKRILGITDSFQGQYDGSAQSGKAKQLQIQQAAGRLDSKRQMKNAAYAEIDKIIFQYYLAYADEPRPAAYRDAYGNMQNRIFNRYDFIECDEAGEWYYNDEYLFRTDATIDIEQSRELLWQENRQNLQSGAYGDPSLPQTQLIFWQNMERAHYPFANDVIERLKEVIARRNQAATMQAQIQDLQAEIKNREGYEGYLHNEINKMMGGAEHGDAV